MIDRRVFTTLLAGGVAAPLSPRLSFGEGAAGRTVFYSGVASDLTLYGVDVDDATLTKRSTVVLPANVQYAWPHPSRQFLYVVSSGGGPGVASDQQFCQCVPHRPRNRRADAAWRAREPAVASDPHQRRYGRRISVDRL